MIMKRIESVDVCRLIAIFAVILIHTQPFAPVQPEINGHFGEPGWVINQAARFAVPFFFVVSGYFWSIKQHSSPDPVGASWAMVRRIALIFGAWSLIYLIPFDVSAMAALGWAGPVKMVYWNVLGWADDPFQALFEGSKSHLWFLPGLLCALLVCAVFMRQQWHVALTLLAVSLFVAAVLGKAYAATPLGLGTGLQMRDGPFFSTLLFATGIILSRRASRPSWLFSGAVLFVLGMACQMAEMYYLSAQYGASPYQDFTFGTYFMGVGFAMAAVSNHPSLRSERLGEIGQYTLGIFAIHFVFVDLLRGATAPASALWQLAYPVIVLLLSVASVLLMARSAKLRRIVA